MRVFLLSMLTLVLVCAAVAQNGSQTQEMHRSRYVQRNFIVLAHLIRRAVRSFAATTLSGMAQKLQD
jgi:hypothetical protein